jgi:hypothetical protein
MPIICSENGCGVISTAAVAICTHVSDPATAAHAAIRIVYSFRSRLDSRVSIASRCAIRCLCASLLLLLSALLSASTIGQDVVDQPLQVLTRHSLSDKLGMHLPYPLIVLLIALHAAYTELRVN